MYTRILCWTFYMKWIYFAGYTTLRRTTLCLLNHFVEKAFHRSVILSNAHLVETCFVEYFRRNILCSPYAAIMYLLIMCVRIFVQIQCYSAQIFQDRAVFIILNNSIYPGNLHIYFRDWLIGACPATNSSIQVCFYEIPGSIHLMYNEHKS